MFKNKININLMGIVLLTIWGCGTMEKEDETLSVPQKVSIKMPKALETKSATEKKYQKSRRKENLKSAGYLELKEDVAFLEEQRVSLEINLLFINEVISKIDRECKEVSTEEKCSILEDKLSFVFDENLSDRLKGLTSKDLGYAVGDTLYFGKVDFIKHLPSNVYRYTLKMDIDFYNETNSSAYENISWSKDERLIVSEYVEESASLKNSIKIDFSRKIDESREIVVDDSLFDKSDNSSDTFHFAMLKRADAEETYELNSSSMAIDSDARKAYFASKGKLSNLGGYLNFNGKLDGELFKEKDVFDENGDIVRSSYCYSGMSCDLEDENSWLRNKAH